MENIDQSTLDQLLNRTTPNLIPESLVSTLTTGLIVINVIGAIFLVLYLVGIIRKWKVQSAVLTMQKDVSEIKHLLGSNTPHNNTATTTSEPVQESTRN